MRRRGKVRIKDIAERANVSIGTVDRVLHKRGEVSEETKIKVMNIVEELNYKPNLVARILASGKQFNIAILSPSSELSGEYWSGPMKGFLRAEEELNPYGIKLHFNHFDQNSVHSFTKATKELMKREYDAIIMAPTFKREALNLTKELDTKSTPYIFFDSNIGEANSLSFVGNDNRVSGTVAAKLMSFGSQPSDNFLIIHLTKERGNQQYLSYREDGFHSYFKENNLSNSVVSIDIDETSNITRELTKVLNTNSDIKGIFVTNSKTSLIAEAIYSLNREDLKIVGYAVIEDNNRYLKKGVIDFLISQSPYEQGYRSVLSIFNALIKKVPIEKTNFTPIDIATKENLPYF